MYRDASIKLHALLLIAFFALGTFLSGLLSPFAEAQDPPDATSPDQQFKIPDLLHAKRVPVDKKKLLQLFRDTTDQIGVEASERDMRNWANKAHFPAQDYFSKSLEDNFEKAAPPPEPKKVISHLRSTQGIALPVKGEFPFPGGPQAAIDPRQLMSATLFGAEQMKKLTEQMPLPRLPRCTDDKTERTGTGVKDDDVANGVLMDFIFVDEDLPKLPMTEIFGDSPIVIKYGDKDMYYLSMISQGLKAPCLPYRVRATIGYLMKDQGLNALKNYNENHLGKGELHEYFKQKYGLLKKKKNDQRKK